MISVLVVLYLKRIYISMEYMQKLLFFAKLIILWMGCTGFLKCGKRYTGCTEVHWGHLEKNSGKVDKNSANGVE